jgi:hypothetical protein
MREGPVNIDKILRAHTKFKRIHHNLFGREVEKIGKFGVNYVKEHPTFKPRTKKLQRATEYKIVKLKSGAVARLLNRMKYASAIEFGARRHMIAARRARALHFRWKGVPMFRRYVIHPGNRPYKFLYRAANAAGRVFVTSMGSGMERIAKQF